MLYLTILNFEMMSHIFFALIFPSLKIILLLISPPNCVRSCLLTFPNFYLLNNKGNFFSSGVELAQGSTVTDRLAREPQNVQVHRFDPSFKCFFLIRATIAILQDRPPVSAAQRRRFGHPEGDPGGADVPRRAPGRSERVSGAEAAQPPQHH